MEPPSRAEADRFQLYDRAKSLPEPMLELWIARANAPTEHFRRGVPTSTRVIELIAWAESSAGPGLDLLSRALEWALVNPPQLTIEEWWRVASNGKGLRYFGAAISAVAFAGLASHGSTFCAAYLDLTLPGVSGAQVLARLRAEHPTLPVVLSSGHDYRTIPSEVRAMATVLLPKPYEMGELLRAFDAAVGANCGG